MATSSQSQTTNQSERNHQAQEEALTLNVSAAKLRTLAIEVLGSAKAAELWMTKAAMGLEKSRPIDLMDTVDGIALVTQLLSRIRYGVHA